MDYNSLDRQWKYSINHAESFVRQAEFNVASAKNSLAQAKANGTFKNSPKMFRGADGKVRNGYEDKVYQAQKLLAERKQQLAQVKANIKAAKAKMAQEERKAKAAEAQKKKDEREAKAAEAQKAKVEKSINRSDKSYNRHSDDYEFDVNKHKRIEQEREDREREKREREKRESIRESAEKILIAPFREKLNEKYPISANTTLNEVIKYMRALPDEEATFRKLYQSADDPLIRDVVKEMGEEILMDVANRVSLKFQELNIDKYVQYLKSSFPINEASDVQIATWLPELCLEIEKKNREYTEGKFKEHRNIAHHSREHVKKLIIDALRRLKSLNRSLYKQPEIQIIVKKFDPEAGRDPMSKFLTELSEPIRNLFTDTKDTLSSSLKTYKPKGRLDGYVVDFIKSIFSNISKK